MDFCVYLLFWESKADTDGQRGLILTKTEEKLKVESPQAPPLIVLPLPHPCFPFAMADYEEGELEEEPPSGRDRLFSSPASPRQDRGGQTHRAGVGAAKEGPQNATILLYIIL